MDFFILLTTYLFVITMLYLEAIHKQWALFIAAIFSTLIFLLMPFYILSAVIAWAIIVAIIDIPQEQAFLFSLSFLISGLISYLIIVMFSFAIAAILNLYRNPFKKYNYIIVLGSGLIGDRVPPLLANRIDKGIHLFKKHYSEDNSVKTVLTGGKGSDELIAEGIAMANYAIAKGIDSSRLIIEDKAINTYENLLFSKRLIDEDWKKQNKQDRPKIIMTTNNFHVIRSLLWTRKVGVKCGGAGAKTKFYFWSNALIREFIAVLSMHRKLHEVGTKPTSFGVSSLMLISFKRYTNTFWRIQFGANPF